MLFMLTADHHHQQQYLFAKWRDARKGKRPSKLAPQSTNRECIGDKEND